MCARAASRSATAAAKASGAEEGGDIGDADGDGDGAASRQPIAGPQQRAGTADRHRQHGNLRRHRRGEAAQVEGREPRRARERALGKDRGRRAGLHGIHQPLRVLDALPGVEPFDELHTEPAQVDARQRLPQQLALGDEAEVRRKRCEQHQSVEIAGVIGHENAGRARQILERRFTVSAMPASRRMIRAASRFTRHADAGLGASVVSSHAGGTTNASSQPDVDAVEDGGRPPPPRAAPAEAANRRPGGPPATRPHARRAPTRPALVQLAAGGAADLAARGLEHRVRRRQHHVVGRLAQHGDGGLDDPRAQRVLRPPRRVSRVSASTTSRSVPRARIGAAEHGDAAPAHAGHRADRVLHLVRIDVAPAADDDVLDAAGEVHLAVGDVGAVAGVEPVAVEQAPRLLRIAVVARGGRRPLELQPSLDALAQLLAERVDDADLVPRQRASAGDEAQRAGIVGGRGLGPPVATEGLAANAVDARPATQRRTQQARPCIRPGRTPASWPPGGSRSARSAR